jgi:gliding motility-associated-like protein
LVDGDQSGIYTVIASSFPGCLDTAEVLVTYLAPPVAGLQASYDICEGNPLELTTLAGLPFYNWANLLGTTLSSSNTVSITVPGDYTLTLRNAACEVVTNFTVNVAPAPVVELFSAEGCRGETVVLRASTTETGSFRWYRTALGEAPILVGETSVSIPLNQPDSVLYVEFVRADGCITARTAVAATQLPTPVAGITHTPDLGRDIRVPGDSLVLVASSTLPGDRRQWAWAQLPGGDFNAFATTGTTVFVPDSAGDYAIRLIETIGRCSDTTTVQPFRFVFLANLFIPNVFSPNGDDLNDIWRPIGQNIDWWEFVIYDRWGRKVYTSPRGFAGWNGQTQNGNPVPEGVYIYQLNVRAQDTPELIVRTGTITLLR